MCSVSLDYYSAIKSQDSYSEEERSYELPDKSVIKIDPKTRYRCTETLFTSSLVGKETFSLPEMMADSLNRCESEL